MTLPLEQRHESAAVRDLINRIDRRDEPARKAQRAAEALQMTLAFMEAGIRHQQPTLSPDQVRRELLRRRLPPDLFHRVYGE